MLNLDTPYVKRRKLPPKANADPHPKPTTRQPDPLTRHNRSGHPGQPSPARHASILWRKPSNRKHKQWDGDGMLNFNTETGVAVVKDSDGGFIGKVHGEDRVFGGGIFRCGGLECQIDGETDAPVSAEPPATKPAPLARPQKIHPPTVHRVPLLARSRSKASSEPLYDPRTIENPLVLPKPTTSTPCRDVVVDPSISKVLRPHQREGVSFLYECMMGIRHFDGHGAILADEMGLGKTLQTIALIWTLVRQTPYIGQPPECDKVLICCPVTLVDNWKREFVKWLGKSLSVLAFDGKQTSFKQTDRQIIRSFASTKVYKVLIIGYEKMQSLASELQDAHIGMVVCDEGHRLKNSKNKVFQALEALNIPRRVVLTGTPIQNDLGEFYTLINFTNPGILGSLKDFQKEYMKPILRARDKSCTNPVTIRAGNNKSQQLIEFTHKFILRRTNVELVKYLPKRSDYLLFVAPTKLQIELFKAVRSTSRFNKLVQDPNSNTKDSLSLITTFRKIANSPSMLKDDSVFKEFSDEQFLARLSKKVKSGKINLFIDLMTQIYQTTSEKVVVISNFTQVLDILQSTLEAMHLTFSRLDGSTPAKQRGGLVKDFNRSSHESCFVFLLSAKAGGVGLNLVGASRLVLFDNDWNPSVDIQAMARIHREGQKLPVKVYRMFTSGCIDEKIFQRQLIKTNLSDRFLDDTGSNEDFFSHSDLRDIFSIDENCVCNTHELMMCDCKGEGEVRSIEEEDEDEESEEEIDEHSPPGFMTALDFSQKPQAEIQSQQTQKQIQKCLKGYRHIDPENKVTTDDTIIDGLMVDHKSSLRYIFAKY